MIYAKWGIRMVLSVLGLPFVLALWAFHDYKPVGGDKSIFGHWVSGIKIPSLIIFMFPGVILAHTQDQIVEQKRIQTQVVRMRPTARVSPTASPTRDIRPTATRTPNVSPTRTPTRNR